MLTSTFISQTSHVIYSTTNTELVKEPCAPSEIDKLYCTLLDIRPRKLYSFHNCDWESHHCIVVIFINTKN